MNRSRSACSSLAVLTPFALLALTPAVHAQWQMSIDATSPENRLGVADPTQLVRMDLPAPPPFFVETTLADLGLIAGDEVDAFSRGADYVPATFLAATGASILYFFSVTRGSVGAAAAVLAETGPTGNGAAGDVFVRVNFTPPSGVPAPSTTGKFREAARIGLTQRGGGAESNVDALQLGSLFYSQAYYFSVDGPTATRLRFDPGAIYVMHGGAPAPQVFATRAALGLRAGDDIDALCVADNLPWFVFGPEDRVMLSLRAGSPTLSATGWSGASLLRFVAGGPLTQFATAGMMGLLATDDLDALWIGDPGGGAWTPSDPPSTAGGIWPSTATYTSRIALGTSEGEVLQCLPHHVLRGLGDVGGCGVVTSIRATVQDQNQSTVEPFRLVLRGEDGHGSGVPMNGPRGGIFQDTFSLPVGPTTPGAWIVTVSTATPVVIPELRSIFVGIGLPAAPAWTTDGLSVHMASYALGASGDNPRAGAPDHSICVAQPGDRVLGSASPRTLAVDVLTPAPCLDIGADIQVALRRGPNPCYGFAGAYPDLAGRRDGLAFRVADAAAAGAVAAVLVSAESSGPPLLSLAFVGSLHLSPIGMTLVAAGSLDAQGYVELRPAALAQGNLPVLTAGTRLAFQAAILAGSSVRLTNARSVAF